MCSTSDEQDVKGAKMANWLHVDTPSELRAYKNVLTLRTGALTGKLQLLPRVKGNKRDLYKRRTSFFSRYLSS